jgi:hypothetical protein
VAAIAAALEEALRVQSMQILLSEMDRETQRGTLGPGGLEFSVPAGHHVRTD